MIHSFNELAEYARTKLQSNRSLFSKTSFHDVNKQHCFVSVVSARAAESEVWSTCQDWWFSSLSAPLVVFNFSNVTGSVTFVRFHRVLKMHFPLTGALNNLMRSSQRFLPRFIPGPGDAAQGRAQTGALQACNKAQDTPRLYHQILLQTPQSILGEV